MTTSQVSSTVRATDFGSVRAQVQAPLPTNMFVEPDPRHWPPGASDSATLGSSYPRRFPERDLRCSTLSGRSERASYLPSVLARKTESGLPLVTTLAGDGFFLYLGVLERDLLASSGPLRVYYDNQPG